MVKRIIIPNTTDLIILSLDQSFKIADLVFII